MGWTMRDRWFSYFKKELKWIEPTDVIYAGSPWDIIQQEADEEGEIFDIVENWKTKEIRYTLI